MTDAASSLSPAVRRRMGDAIADAVVEAINGVAANGRETTRHQAEAERRKARVGGGRGKERAVPKAIETAPVGAL